MKVLRIVFFAALALVSIVVVGASIFIATFDANRYKSEIEQLVLEQTGRTLRIEGDIDLTLFPNLGAELGKTTLTEKDPKQAFLTFTSTRASVALMPLLQGQVLVDGITIDGLTATIVRDKNGKLSFADLLPGETSTATPDQARPLETNPTSSQSTQPLQFDINGIAVTHANVVYRDEQDGLDLAASKLSLRTGRIAPDATGKLELSAAVASSKLALETTISLTGEYALDLGRQLARLENLQIKTQGQWQNFKLLDSAISLGLQVAMDGPAYTASDLSLKVKAQDSLQTINLDAQSGEVQLDHAAITVKPAQVKLNVSSGTGAGRRTIDSDIGLPGFRYVNDNLSLQGLKATISMLSPSLGDKPWITEAQGDLSINVKQEALSTNLKGRLDGSPFTAVFDMRQFSHPSLAFDVELDRLNLDRFSEPGSATNANTPATASSASTVTKTPLSVDLSALKGHQVKGKLSIKHVARKALAVQNLNANITLDQGRLSIAPHSAELFGGKVSGSLLVDSNTDHLTVKETLSHIQVDAMLAALGQPPRLTGQGSLAIDINTSGKTTQALEQNLAGTASIQLRDGAIKGIDIRAILNQVRSLLGKAPTQQGATGGQTTFTEMKASVSIQNGIATNRDLSVKAPLFRVEGHGTLNLAQSSVDYLAKVAVVESSTGQGGADLAKLRGLTVPVRITGKLDKPNYQVDISSLAAELAKSQLGDKAQQEINKVMPGLGDAIKGLFGR